MHKFFKFLYHVLLNLAHVQNTTFPIPFPKGSTYICHAYLFHTPALSKHFQLFLLKLNYAYNLTLNNIFSLFLS